MTTESTRVIRPTVRYYEPGEIGEFLARLKQRGYRVWLSSLGGEYRLGSE